MARRLKVGHILVNDRTAGTLYPLLIRTLARFVIFPDGRSLIDHWDEEMSERNKAKFITEQTVLGNDTFHWEINLFGDENVVMSSHIVKGIPVQTGNNTYRFEIALPTLFVPVNRALRYNSSSVTVTERINSTFIKRKCQHSIYTDFEGDTLIIYVEHYKSADSVNLSTEPYIQGDFNISLQMAFHT